MSDHHERREYNLEMAHTLGRIEGKLDSLCGPEGRVTKLEHSQEKQWWVSFVITPIVIALGHIARALGVKYV